MSWDEDFYQACLSNSNFSAGVTTLFMEYNENAVSPFAKYQLITATGTDDLQGVGDEGERNVQLSVWSASPRLSRQLIGYAKSGVKDNLKLQSVYERSLGFDEDEKLFGYAIDFFIWFDNP